MSEERSLLPGQKDPRHLPEITSTRRVHEGAIVGLSVDEIELDGGRIVSREVLSHPGAVVVAALDAEDCLYLVDQYRHPARRYLLELPAGCLEIGEEPLETAKRELREEVGLEAADWSHIGTFYSSPGFADEILYAFLARDLTAVGTDPDEDEDLGLVRYPLGTLLAELDRIQDAKTLATLLLVAEKTGLLPIGGK